VDFGKGRATVTRRKKVSRRRLPWCRPSPGSPNDGTLEPLSSFYVDRSLFVHAIRRSPGRRTRPQYRRAALVLGSTMRAEQRSGSTIDSPGTSDKSTPRVEAGLNGSSLSSRCSLGDSIIGSTSGAWRRNEALQAGQCWQLTEEGESAEPPQIVTFFSFLGGHPADVRSSRSDRLTGRPRPAGIPHGDPELL